MNLLAYLLQVNLYLFLFYMFYLIVLRNETFFKMNRFYLVGAALLSLSIPLMKTDWVKDLLITEKVQVFTQKAASTLVDPGIELLNAPLMVQNESSLTTMEWLWLAYAMVSLAFLLNFLRRLYKVNRWLKAGTKGRAFSFFNKVAVDEDLEGKDVIISHEMVHVRQWHSADVIFFEILLAVNWFNPIVYCYRNAIKNIHEFIADDAAASTLEDRSAYAILLVSNVFNTQPQKLTNSFFNQSLLKRRIIMLHKTKSRQVAILKYGLSVPLFAGMLIFSATTTAIAKVGKTISPLLENLDNMPPPQAQLQPTTKNESSSVKPAEKPAVIPVEEKQPVATPKNLLDYVGTIYEKATMRKVAKEGNIYVSFKVGKDKHAANFKIMKSINSKWEKELITDLDAFTDTLNLPQGKYHFVIGFASAGNEDILELSKNEPTPLFKKSRVEGPGIGTAEELENGLNVYNTYVSFVALANPIIIVDNKEVDYVHTKMGLKLTQSIYPRVSASSKVLKGDKAVEQYGEGARKGVIVITTKEDGNPDAGTN